MKKDEMIKGLTDGMFGETEMRGFLTEVRDTMVKFFLKADTDEKEKSVCHIYYEDLSRLIELL